MTVEPYQLDGINTLSSWNSSWNCRGQEVTLFLMMVGVMMTYVFLDEQIYGSHKASWKKKYLELVAAVN